MVKSKTAKRFGNAHGITPSGKIKKGYRIDKSGSIKKKDGRSVKTAAHRKAISEGLKAYHAGKPKDGVKELRKARATAKSNVAAKRAARKATATKDGGAWGNVGASIANAALAAGFKTKAAWEKAGSPNQRAMAKLAKAKLIKR